MADLHSKGWAKMYNKGLPKGALRGARKRAKVSKFENQQKFASKFLRLQNQNSVIIPEKGAKSESSEGPKIRVK